MVETVYTEKWQQINVRLHHEEKETFKKECQKIGKACSNVLRTFIQTINSIGIEDAFSPDLMEDLRTKLIEFEEENNLLKSENEKLVEDIAEFNLEIEDVKSLSKVSKSNLKDQFNEILRNKNEKISELKTQIEKLNSDLAYQNNNSILNNSELKLLVENYFIQARKVRIFNRKFSFEDFINEYPSSNFELLKAFIKVDEALAENKNLSTQKLKTLFQNSLK